MQELKKAVKSRKRKPSLKVVGCICGLGAIATGGWAGLQLQPVSGDATKKQVIIPNHTNVAGISHILEDSGVIRSARIFQWYIRLTGNSAGLKAGTFRLSPSMTPGEITSVLHKGGAASNANRLTVPEGWNIRQVGQLLIKKQIAKDESDFDTIAGPKSITKLQTTIDRPSTGWEGYLFPDTYDYTKTDNSNSICQRMVTTFEERFFRPYGDEVAKSGHTLHEIVTIASMVEMEAETDSDRSKIAGVIENRLKRGMKLDIDATVLYALGRHKNRVMYKDLKIDSPYNTYRHKGLPPGPIASPGLPSLLGALRPEKSDFLFYVAGPGKSHIFTRTEAEHNAAVAKWKRARSHGSGQETINVE